MPDTKRTSFQSPWHRLLFAVCYALLMATGRIAARLAADFRILGTTGKLPRPVSVVLQLPVFACWLVVRPISLAAYAACCAVAPG